MKPRIFVSSTYYDLKYVRENLERFIHNYNFEPVLFESGNVIFEHDEELDVSCYNEVKLCHMMILIIGGRYGSIATGDNNKTKVQKYESHYISITRNEYETALKKNIPVYIFIDKNVYSEYQTFTENKLVFEDLLKTKNSGLKFAHVDSPNVFKFIDYLKNKPIKTFEKFEEIEDYLKNQISGLFYLYLEQLQRKKEDERILDTVSELNNVTQRMNEMIKEVGRKVIGEDDYKKITTKQSELLIEFYVQSVNDNLSIEAEIKEDLPIETCEKLAKALYITYISDTALKEAWEKSNYKEYFVLKTKKKHELHDQFFKIDKRLRLNDVDYERVGQRYLENIKPIIDNDETGQLKEFLLKSLTKMIEEKTSTLPF